MKKKGGFAVNLTQLEYYLALHRAKNFSIAATQLFITQPALSRSIAALEEELGVDLIIRSTRKLSFTVAGEEFARICGDMLHTYKNGLSVIKKHCGVLAGQVIVGLPLESYNNGAMDFLVEMRRKYPDIKIKSKYYSPNGMLRAMDDGFVDIIFSAYVPRSRNLGRIPFATYPRYVAMSRDNPLAQRTQLGIDDLRGECFFSQTARTSIDENEIALQLAHTVPYAPHIEEICSSVNEILARVLLDNGICVLPAFYESIAPEHIKFVPLQDVPDYVEYFIWVKQENPCLNVLVQEALEQFNRKGSYLPEA